MQKALLEIVLPKLTLYAGCAVPSFLFYMFTCQQTIKQKNPGTPDWLLVALGFAEVLTPIAFNGRGSILDRVICAIMAIIMTSSMFFYIRDRSQTPEGKPLAPFYEFLTRWNQKEPDHKKDDDSKSFVESSLSTIRTDALKFLARAIVYGILYVPVFSTADGFIRACQEPPEISQNIPYLQRLATAPIPAGSTFYYIWVGVTLSFHIALIPLIHLLLHAIQLNIMAWIPNASSRKVLAKLHNDLDIFVKQPPLFDKPWLTKSVYDLWSKRWHQIFKPGFHQVAYNPVRCLFGKNHATAGRIVGTLTVFLCSGLMHDYIILSMLGYSNWKTPGVFGYQSLFFLLQGIATIVSVKSPVLPSWLSRTLTWIWVLYTAPFFVEPYVRIGLHLNAEVPGFPKFMDGPIGAICPYGVRTTN